MTEDYLQFVTSLPEHWDDVEWLSKAVVRLSTLLYNHNTVMAEKELVENQARIALLDMPLGSGDKKMSFSEADARAIVQTNNEYKTWKVQAEAIVETINSIKKRLDVLAWEHRS